MSPGAEIAIWVVFFVLALLFVILAFLVLRPKDVTQMANNNTLQNAFNTGNEVQVDALVKPFSVGVALRPNPIQQAVSFSDLGTTDVIFPANPAVLANRFQVFDFVEVTSLQIFADLFDRSNTTNTSRPVGIYNQDTGALLVASYVDMNDPLIAGFRTRALDPSQYVTLFENVNYVIAAVCFPSDTFATSAGIVYPLQQLTFLSSAVVPGSAQLMLPDKNQFTANLNNLQFASFQVRLATTVNQTGAMTVDTATGLATFPPNYAIGLNCEVLDNNQVRIDPGVCSNVFNDVNMRSDGELFVSATDNGPNGLDVGSLEPDQWYGVFLINSTLQGLAPAGIMSKNLQEPFLQPIGYDTFRRVGWVLTDHFSNLKPTFQIGDGAQRVTFYRTPPLAFAHNFTPLDMTSIPPVFYELPLPEVSAPGSSAQLTFVTTNPNSDPLDLLLRPRFATNTDVILYSVPLGTYTQTLVTNIRPQPIPHAIEIALRQSGTTPPGSNVSVTCYVVSFVSDI